MTDLIAELVAEVQRASSLYPDHASLPETLGVLFMELGEVMEAAHRKNWEHAEEELIQVAAVALRGVIASRNRREPAPLDDDTWSETEKVQNMSIREYLRRNPTKMLPDYSTRPGDNDSTCPTCGQDGLA